MNQPDRPDSRKSRYRTLILKSVFLYVLFPVLCLICLAQPIGDAVRASDQAAFQILLAGLGCVILNWLVYIALHRKRPPVPVFAWGIFCLLVTAVIENEALPGNDPLTSTLTVIGGCLLLALLFLLSYWFADRRSRPAHVIVVGLWITIAVMAFFMAIQVIRDIEVRQVTQDTWISIVILIALVPAAFSRRIISSVRDAELRRRATGLARGEIVQVIGETHLDLDDDLVTDYHVRIEYTVDGALYETKADITRSAIRKYGRDLFIGQEVPVHYEPEAPEKTITDRIDRHFFDPDKKEEK